MAQISTITASDNQTTVPKAKVRKIAAILSERGIGDARQGEGMAKVGKGEVGRNKKNKNKKF